MVDQNKFRNVRDFFQDHYTVTALSKRFMNTRDFVIEHQNLCITEGISAKDVNLAEAKSLNKNQKCVLIAIPYASKKLFNAFLNYLPEEVATVFKELVWHDQLNNKDLEKMLNIEVCNKLAYKDYYGRTQYKLSLKNGFEVFD